MSKASFRTWIEPIDDKVACACCEMTETYRGAIYGASAILLFEVPERAPWSAKRQAIDEVRTKLARELAWQHHRMSLVGWIRDIARA